MENLTIPFIVLAVMFVAVVIGWSETWKKKEHYRCRVFELTNGKEGSNLPKTSTLPPPKEPEDDLEKETLKLEIEWKNLEIKKWRNLLEDYYQTLKDFVALAQKLKEKNKKLENEISDLKFELEKM